MTAEGDNSVLMQKVAKEHLGLFKPHKWEVESSDVKNYHHLIYLMKARENTIHADLYKKMRNATAFTKVGKKVTNLGLKSFGDNIQEKGVFNTWMYDEQDKIQAFAKAYADRIVAEAFLETINENTGKGDEFKDMPIGPSPLSINASADLGIILKKLFHLHLLSRVEEDLSFFLISGLLSEEAGQEVIDYSRKLCAELAPHALSLVEGTLLIISISKLEFLINFV